MVLDVLPETGAAARESTLCFAFVVRDGFQERLGAFELAIEKLVALGFGYL
jgi:hypothetical protein